MSEYSDHLNDSKNAKYKARKKKYSSFKSASNSSSNQPSESNDIQNPIIGSHPHKEMADNAKLTQRQMRFSEENRKHANSFGYVSRGEDKRLQKSATEREAFFQNIMASFIIYCNENSTSVLSRSLPKIMSSQECISQDNLPDRSTTVDLILANLRKLREALLHVKTDDFCKNVFLFSIRVASTIGHYQTYIPSIMFLLQKKNFSLLTELEVAEITTLLILHLSHFNGDNSAALRYYFKYLAPYKELKTLHTLRSWIHRDYFNWFRLYNTETDNAKFRVMSFGLDGMVQSMIKCISNSYYTMNIKDLEGNFTPEKLSLQDLVRNYHVQWRQEDGNVIIRERKTK